jgi:hypothetical protein
MLLQVHDGGSQQDEELDDLIEEMFDEVATQFLCNTHPQQIPKLG